MSYAIKWHCVFQKLVKIIETHVRYIFEFKSKQEENYRLHCMITVVTINAIKHNKQNWNWGENKKIAFFSFEHLFPRLYRFPLGQASLYFNSSEVTLAVYLALHHPPKWYSSGAGFFVFEFFGSNTECLFGITPPSGMITSPSNWSDSESLFMACMWFDGDWLIRYFLLSAAAFPANSNYSAVRYS